MDLSLKPRSLRVGEQRQWMVLDRNDGATKRLTLRRPTDDEWHVLMMPWPLGPTRVVAIAHHGEVNATLKTLYYTVLREVPHDAEL